MRSPPTYECLKFFHECHGLQRSLNHIARFSRSYQNLCFFWNVKSFKRKMAILRASHAVAQFAFIGWQSTNVHRFQVRDVDILPANAFETCDAMLDIGEIYTNANFVLGCKLDPPG